MDFDGTSVFTLWNWTPDTRPAIKWHQVANGSWRGSDRGAAEDVFEAAVTFEGPRSELEDLETFLDNNRRNFDATFGEGEEVFGADIDYSSSIQITVVEYGEIMQLGFDKWGMPLKLRAKSPSFLSVSGSLDCLRLSSFASSQFSEFDITKQFTYDELAYFNDHASDPGFFHGEFTQTTFEMKQIRRYFLDTIRNGSDSPFPDFGGITTPFGYREGTGPFTFRIIEWQDLGRPNFTDWKLRIKFAREF